ASAQVARRCRRPDRHTTAGHLQRTGVVVVRRVDADAPHPPVAEVRRVTLGGLWHQRRADELRALAVRSRHAVVLAAIVGVATGAVVAGFDELVVHLQELVAQRSAVVVALAPTAGLAIAAIALRTG